MKSPDSRIGFSEDGPRLREKSCRNGLTAVEAEREWFIRMLWRAFHEAHSENELADLVAKLLTTKRRPINARTVRYWLRGDTTPHFRYVMPILALAGAERISMRRAENFFQRARSDDQ